MKHTRIGKMLIPEDSIYRIRKRYSHIPPSSGVYLEAPPEPEDGIAVDVWFLFHRREWGMVSVEGQVAIDVWSDFLARLGIEDDPELLEVVL